MAHSFIAAERQIITKRVFNDPAVRAVRGDWPPVLGAGIGKPAAPFLVWRGSLY